MFKQKKNRKTNKRKKENKNNQWKRMGNMTTAEFFGCLVYMVYLPCME